MSLIDTRSSRLRLVGAVLAAGALTLSLAGCLPQPDFGSNGVRDGGTGIDGNNNGGDNDTDGDGDGDGVKTAPDGTVRCTSGQNLTIDETVLDYTLTGDCGDIAVRGTGIDVHLEKARSVLVEGQRNDIEASGEVTKLVVRGDGNEVSAKRMSTALVQGNENDVEAGVIDQVEAQGNDNVFETDEKPSQNRLNGNGNKITGRD